VLPDNDDDGVDCDDDMKQLGLDADEEIDFTRDPLGTRARQVEFLESAVARSNKDDDKPRFMASTLLDCGG
jgi:hypothetical protein